MSMRVKRNILYVENGIGYGGAIICLRHLVRNLDRSRFTPLVVTGRTSLDYQDIANESQWQYIADRTIDNVGLRARLAKVAWLNDLPVLRFMSGQVLARADDMFNFLPFFLRLLWTAKCFRADLIHANNEPLCNRAALLVGKVLCIPCVCHVRGGDHEGSGFMQWTYSLPDHFISVSQWVSKSMRDKLHIPAEKISVVYDGIALEKLDIHADGAEFRRIYDIPDEAFAVGLVGLLIPWKGQALFLDAAKLLREKIPLLKMLIIGGTPDDCLAYEDMLRQRVSDEQLTGLIVFTGHVSTMETVYNGLDVVLSASTAPEPLGTVVIEAMAMGRPLIGPNHGGAKEMMQHEVTGLLFTPGDAQSLADSIERLYRNKTLRFTLGVNARLAALNAFEVETHVEHIQSVYQQLLKSGR
ncbi:MAG: glycosyltransferase family 4 protein [Methylococcaceae bacterium]